MEKKITIPKIWLKVMKISLTQLFMAILFTSVSFANDSHAQGVLNHKMTLAVKDESLKSVLNQIEKELNVRFSYNAQTISASRKVTLTSEGKALSKILDDMFSRTGVHYELIGTRQIILSKAPPSVQEVAALETKPIRRVVVLTITGKVVDENAAPLVGASIVLKGSQKGALTDADGNYSLELTDADKNGSLAFSFVGYEEQTIPINGQSVINVTLREGKSLNEIVVVGYGSQIKKEVTGSVQTVAAKELKDLPVSQITQKLQGRLAGVQINQATGKPGQGMTVRIRGQASILANSDPLYVVDGFPIVGDISNINPDEIENISVLKDAASTSLYGSRAANGVILITTKGAKPNRTEIGLNVYTGWATVPQKGRPSMMNAQEFAQFKKESAEDLGVAVPTAFQNPSQYASTNNDWYGSMLRTAPIKSYNLTFATGTDKFSATVVAGILNQDGVMLNSDFNRYSLRINTLYKPTNQIRMGFNLAPNVTTNNTPSSDGAFYATNISSSVPGGLLYNATLTWPILPFQDKDGSLPLTAWIPGISAFPTPNWYRALNEITNKTQSNRLLTNAFLEVEPIAGLKLKSTINVDFGNSALNNFTPSTASTIFAALPPTTNSLIQRNDKYISWANENTATYTKSIGDHNLEFLAGYTAQKFSSDATQLRFTSFADDRIKTIQSAVNIDRTGSTSEAQEWSLLSYLARVNYNYKGKYLLQLSMRRDGSSRFGADNRWGNFPSIGAGWVLSDEDFLKGNKTISFAKLRGSFGIIGNNNIGNYTQYALVNNSASAVFGSTVASGAFVSSLGNAKLGWETTKQMDIGVDLGLFNDRIELAYDFYNKNTTNLLYNVAVTQESGFSNFNDNIGELRFWGHELTVTSRNLVGDFKWTTNLNLSNNQNKVIALAGGVERIYGGFGSYQTITQVGQPIGQFYGLVQQGVYKNKTEFDASPKALASQVGTIKYQDVNGDGKITYGGDNDDRKIIGSPFPTLLFGFVNTFSYKNFDLGIVCSGSLGSSLMVLTEQGQTNLDGVFNVLKNVKDRWRSEANPGNGIYGKTTAATGNERDWESTRFVSSGDYFTIKNITLGYTLPLQSKFFKNVRLYTSIQQAAVFTKYRGSNPETSTAANGTGGSTLNLGMDWTTYPVPRTVSIGANLGF